MATKRVHLRAERQLQAQERNVEQLFGVLQLCCTKVKLATSMCLLARLAASSRKLEEVVRSFVQEHVGQLLPPIAVAARQELALYLQMHQEGNAQAAEQHRTYHETRTLPQAQFLCGLAGKEALTRHAAALLSVRCMPLQLIQMIQQAGLQVTTAQLVAAARSHVEGYESWVMASFCVQPLQPIVQAICTAQVDKVIELLAAMWEEPAGTHTQSDMADLLHLAVNLQDPSAAVAMLQFVQQLRQQLVNMQQLQTQLQELQQDAGVTRDRRSKAYRQQQKHAQQAAQLQQRLQEFDQQVNAAEVEQLLATAIARMHVAVVEQLCALPAARELKGAAIMPLIQRCIVHKLPTTRVLELLLRLAATADATAALAATFGKLAPNTALDRMLSFNVRSSQQTLSAEHAQQQKQDLQELREQLHLANPLHACALLKTALQHGNADATVLCTGVCLELPAAQAFDDFSLADLLRTAVQSQGNYATSVLCVGVPGIQELPVEHLAPLLLLAVQLRNYSAAQQLLQLPSAAGLGTAGVQQLLNIAVAAQAGEQLVHSLLALPASRHIDSNSAAALLMSSLCDGPDYKVLAALVEMLPAAAEVHPSSFAQVIGHLVAGFDDDDDACVETLEKLIELSPAVDNLAASDVLTVFMAAAQMNKAVAFELLYALPTADELSPDQLYDVMQQALQHSRCTAARAVYVLCGQLELVAAQMQPQQVYAIALAVAQSAGSKEGMPASSFGALEVLSELPGMQEISVDDVAHLAMTYLKNLQGLPHDKLAALVATLLTVPSAQQLKQSQMAYLLSAAITRHLYGCAVLLLQLPTAQVMDRVYVLSCVIAVVQRMYNCQQMQAAEEVFKQLLELPVMQQSTEDHKLLYSLVHEVVHLPQKLQSSDPLDPAAAAYVAQRHVVWLQHLLASPAAGQCPVKASYEMLRYALQRQPAAAAVLCCKLPALQQLDAAAVAALLTTAVACPEQVMQQSGSCSSESAIGRLCALPGAQQLQPQVLHALLQCALLQDRPTAVECLAAVEGPAAGIGREALLALLQSAVRRKSGMGLAAVGRLLAPHGLSRPEAAALLVLNEDMGEPFDQSLAALLLGLVP